jgi:cell division protein ZipA
MTSLRIALLVVGLLVVVVIALISYDKLRLVKGPGRRRGWGGRRRGEEPVLGRQEDGEEEDLSLLDERLGMPVLHPDSEMLAQELEMPSGAQREMEIEGEDKDEPTRATGPEPAAAVDADAEQVPLTAPAPAAEPRPEPKPKPAPAQPRPASQPRAGAEAQSPDERIDFVAELPGEAAVRRDAVLSVYRQHEYVIEKTHRVFGLSRTHKVWRDLEKDVANGEYGDIRLAIQLTDSSGPIDESELNRFAQLGLRIAEELGRPITFSSSFEEALEKAAGLEDFCKTYDMLAILNIVAVDGTVFRGRDIEREAMRAGMHLGAMNIFHKRDRLGSAGRTLYSLANLYKPGEFERDKLGNLETRGVSLFMNIPCTPNPARVFADMVKTARQMSKALGGTIHDPDKHALDDAALERITRQIEDVASGMTKYGLAAGDDTTKRLF